MTAERNQHSIRPNRLREMADHIAPDYPASAEDLRFLADELIGLYEQLEAEAQYRVKAEQAIARLEEAVRVCGRHLYDCCRSDINWKLQIETHDQAVNAVAWVECDEPYPQKAQR